MVACKHENLNTRNLFSILNIVYQHKCNGLYVINFLQLKNWAVSNFHTTIINTIFAIVFGV